MRTARWLAVLVVFVLFVPLAAYAAGDTVRVDLVADRGDTIVLDVHLAGLVDRTVLIDGTPYRAPFIPGEPVDQVAGAPALPFISRSVILPDDMDFDAAIVRSSCREESARIAPSKGPLPRTIDPATVPYAFGPEYGRDELQPVAAATLGTAYVLRDHRGAALRINPLRYNPVRGTLRICDELRVELHAARAARVNALAPGRTSKPSAAFEQVYAHRFVNYASHAAPRSKTAASFDEQGELLVIAYDAFISNLQPFADHKNGIGVKTTIVGVSTIGNDSAKIKTYIQNYYNAHDLAFVLLVGDAAQVATPHASGGSSDPSYAKLAGSDDYPDILVGRFSASTAAQVDTQVQRTVEYETMPATTQAWFKRGVGIASDQGGGGQGDDGESDRDHENKIRAQLMGIGWTPVDQIYDPGATRQQVSDAVNAGRGIINYTGHGSDTSWGTTGFSVNDVNALVNKDQLPFIVSVACVNGNFENNDTCFAESWLRATKDGRPTGAIGFYGSSINQSWDSPMHGQDEFNRMFTDPSEPWHDFGALCFAGSIGMMDAYGSDGVNMFNTWHVFGDPSVRIVGVAVPPTGLRVTPADGFTTAGPLTGPFVPATTTYTLINQDPAPLDFAVTADAPWVRVTPASGRIEVGGTATITVAVTDATANLDFGSYAGTLQFVNTSTHDGDTTRAVALKVGTAGALHAWKLDQDPGWTRQGEWQFGAPQGKGGSTGNPDPSAAASGSNVFGANLAGDISTTIGGPYWLTVGPLDLSNVTGTRIEFQRWLNTVGPPSGGAWVSASNDGTTWNLLWAAPKNQADSAWTKMSLNASAIADGHSTVWFRFGYDVKRSVASMGSGWNIDDVQIVGVPATARTVLTVNPGALLWTPIGSATGYDVVAGDLARLTGTGGNFATATTTCVADDVTATTFPSSDRPAAGAGTWYLVRGVMATGPLTYQDLVPSQVGQRDPGITASGVACP